ncbi:MAG: hypothetical protein JXJ04_15000 [Spirochaetales bacterium]|nr:hypothetical protein [Spirochaetales bacterium]
MGIAFIIVGGLVLMTLFAAGFDFLTKRRKTLDNATITKVAELEKKVAILESLVNDKNDRIAQLEEDVSFVNKFIEKK